MKSCCGKEVLMPNELNQRVKLYSPTTGRESSYGGKTAAFALSATVWASVKASRAPKEVQLDRVVYEDGGIVVKIRAIAGPAPGWRVEHSGVMYHVVGVDPVLSGSTVMTIHARRVVS